MLYSESSPPMEGIAPLPRDSLASAVLHSGAILANSNQVIRLNNHDFSSVSGRASLLSAGNSVKFFAGYID